MNKQDKQALTWFLNGIMVCVPKERPRLSTTPREGVIEVTFAIDREHLDKVIKAFKNLGIEHTPIQDAIKYGRN